jgi:hypothetical protein
MEKDKIWDSLDAFKRVTIDIATGGVWNLEIFPMISDPWAQEGWKDDWRRSYERSVASGRENIVIWKLGGSCIAPSKSGQESFAELLVERQPKHKFLDLCNGTAPSSGGGRKHFHAKYLLQIADSHPDHWVAYYQTWGQRISPEKADESWMGLCRSVVLKPLAEEIPSQDKGSRAVFVVQGGTAAITFLGKTGVVRGVAHVFEREYGPVAKKRLLFEAL